MPNFTSKFTALIEADGTGAVRELGKISKAADKANQEAGKATDGLKSKISGFASSISPAALAGGFAAAGAAVGAFAVSAVGHFKDLGVEIGKFHDATGISNVESSKFVNLADDLGVGAETLQGAIGKMNKAAGATPGIFQAAGINIAYAKDGTVDANQTFLNTVDVLSNMKDPAERATLATKLFGKGYQQAANIIFGGTQQIKASFDSINAAQVFDDAKVKKARDVQAAFADLGDAIDSLELSIGENLAPAMAKAATATAQLLQDAQPLLSILTPIADGAGAVADALGKVADVAGAIKGALGPVGKVFDGIGAGAKAMARSFVDPIGAVDGLAHSIGGLFHHTDEQKTKTEELTHAQDAQSQQASALVAGMQAQYDAQQQLNQQDAAGAAQAIADADKNAADAANKLADAQNAAADAIAGRADAQRAATDDIYAMQKADSDFGKSLGDVSQAQTDLGDAFNKTDYKDKAEKTKAVAEAYGKLIDSQDAARQSAVDLSLTVVKSAQDDALASGAALTRVQSLDLQNASLLKSAQTAKGPVRDAILGYIGNLNKIPPEKVSEIQALLDKGDIAGAEALINSTSRTRQVDMNADAHTAQAEKDLNYAARSRVAVIEAALAAGGSQNAQVRYGAHANGGVAKGLSLVGERGPELIDVGRASRVYTAGQTAAMLGGGTVVNNFTINAGMGADGNQLGRIIVEHLRAYTRTNGPLPVKVAA